MRNLQRAMKEQPDQDARAVRSALLLLTAAQRHTTTPAAALAWARERANSAAVLRVLNDISRRVRVLEHAEKRAEKAPQKTPPDSVLD